MSFLKKALLATAVLLSTNSMASAAVISFSTVFGPTRTDFMTDQLLLQSFNPTLGILTGVQLSLTGSGTFNGTVMNHGTSTESFTLNEGTALTIASAIAGLNGLTTSFASSQTFTNLAPGATADFGPFSPMSTTMINPLNLSTFQSGPLSFSASTLTSTSTSGGGGNVTTAFNTFASGVVGVTYTYDAPSTNVPEPASMAVLGAGLLGIGRIYRRKA